MSQGTATWLTNAVQLGFVAGAVLSAALNLPDRLSCRVLIAASAGLGAAATVLFVLVARQPGDGDPASVRDRDGARRRLPARDEADRVVVRLAPWARDRRRSSAG